MTAIAVAEADEVITSSGQLQLIMGELPSEYSDEDSFEAVKGGGHEGGEQRWRLAEEPKRMVSAFVVVCVCVCVGGGGGGGRVVCGWDYAPPP